MATPSLPWLLVNALTVTLAGSTLPQVLDGIYTLLTTTTTYDDGAAIPANAQFQVARYQNAGVTEAVYCIPAATSPVAGKAIWIWAGAASGTHASTVMIAPHTYANNVLIFGVYVANAGVSVSLANYSAWDAVAPFTSGGRFTGYCRQFVVGVASKLFLFSCAEYLALQLEDTTGYIWPVGGGFGLEGLTDGAVDGESGLGGRVFDFGTSGTGATPSFTTDWWTADNTGFGRGFLGNSNSPNSCAWWYLQPGTSTLRRTSFRNGVNTYQPSSAVSQTGLSGAIQPDALAFRDVSAGGNVDKKIGRHRFFFVGPRRKTKAILAAGATKLWIAFGQSTTIDNDAALCPYAQGT